MRAPGHCCEERCAEQRPPEEGGRGDGGSGIRRRAVGTGAAPRRHRSPSGDDPEPRRSVGDRVNAPTRNSRAATLDCGTCVRFRPGLQRTEDMKTEDRRRRAEDEERKSERGGGTEEDRQSSPSLLGIVAPMLRSHRTSSVLRSPVLPDFAILLSRSWVSSGPGSGFGPMRRANCHVASPHPTPMKVPTDACIPVEVGSGHSEQPDGPAPTEPNPRRRPNPILRKFLAPYDLGRLVRARPRAGRTRAPAPSEPERAGFVRPGAGSCGIRSGAGGPESDRPDERLVKGHPSSS